MRRMSFCLNGIGRFRISNCPAHRLASRVVSECRLKAKDAFYRHSSNACSCAKLVAEERCRG